MAIAGEPTVSITNVLATLPDAPVVTTRERDWDGITLDLHCPQRGYWVNTPARDHHLICYCPSGNARIVQARDGKSHGSVFSAGMSLLMPAGLDSVWEGDAPATARLRVPAALVVAAAEQAGGRAGATPQLRNIFEMRDPMIERIALALMAELDHAPHALQPMIAERLSCALAAHLVRSHSDFATSVAPEGSSLGRTELSRLTRFIEDNLDRPITLHELANVVRVSRFHFARLFKRSTGVTAISFVEQLRIRRAQSLIVNSDMPLAEIALMAGFADQSHFTRRFRHRVGCTPAAFARENGRRRATRRA